MEWVSKALELLKLPLRIIVFFAIITGLLLFLPSYILTKLKLTEFINEYGKYFGIAFLISCGYVIFTIIPAIFKFLKDKLKERMFLNNLYMALSDLSYPERCLLREFLIQDKHVIEAPLENTEVASLLNKGIIEFASETSRSLVFGTFVFIQVNKHVRPLLNHTVYGLPSIDPTELNLDKVKKERPDYIERLEYVNNIMNGKSNYF